MKNKSNILILLAFVIGLSLLLYPSVSDYWNSFHQSRAISYYAETVAEIDNGMYDRIWADAEAYNRELADNHGRYLLSEAEAARYESLLNVAGNGVMGYIEIPSIRCSLPIYHGLDEEILQVAIGHMDGTSLPVGGAGTHCVLSGHRGLPSAKLFTNLDQLAEGDIFLLRVLDETLTYQVDQILIVEPQDVSALAIEEGKDLCTLVTCTPYGVNTHRLLVRGHRIANQAGANDIRVTADAMQVDPVLVAPVVAVPLVGLLVIGLLLTPNKKRREK